MVDKQTALRIIKCYARGRHELEKVYEMLEDGTKHKENVIYAKGIMDNLNTMSEWLKPYLKQNTNQGKNKYAGRDIDLEVFFDNQVSINGKNTR